MKTAEELSKEKRITSETMHHNYDYLYRAVCKIIEQAQKEAYNQALEDSVEKAEVIEIEIIPPKPYDQRPYTKYIVNKDSILKLKK